MILANFIVNRAILMFKDFTKANIMNLAHFIVKRAILMF